MFEPAMAEQKKAITAFGSSPLYFVILGNMYDPAGKRPEALKVLYRVKEQSKRKYISPYNFAMVYSGLGEGSGLRTAERKGDPR